MSVLEDAIVDRREDTVRKDLSVREAERIMETARGQLLQAVVEADLAETQRLVVLFTRASLLKDDTEDEVRVRTALLTQVDAARRAMARRMATQPPECRCGRRTARGKLLARTGMWLLSHSRA